MLPAPGCTLLAVGASRAVVVHGEGLVGRWCDLSSGEVK